MAGPLAPHGPAGPVVTVRYWAGARRAAGRRDETVIAPDVATLRAVLQERPELAAIVAASSLLVDGATPHDQDPLRGGAVVGVLPPFAGGRVTRRRLSCSPAAESLAGG